jgi:hypothetical protein
MSAATETTGEDCPDNLDQVLRTYFRSEVPSPWPSLPAPGASQPAAPVRSHRMSQSRLMLAASIFALLLGSWLLTGQRLGPANSGISLQEGAAKVPMDLRRDLGPRGR